MTADTFNETLMADIAKGLSESVKTRALFYAVSDTAASLAYTLFDVGKALERLNFGAPLEDEREKEFVSKLRKVKVQEIKSEYDFTNEFFKKQKVFIPGLRNPNLEPGSEWHVSIPGLNPDDLERVDFVSGATTRPLPRNPFLKGKG
jgi:hypothetical protein